MTSRWAAVRTLAAESCERFVTLLRSVHDPRAATTEGWRIPETALHAWVVCAMDAHTATFGDIPFPDAEVLELIKASSVDGIARLNAVSLQRFPERDLGMLADRIEKEVDGLLRATAHADGGTVGQWLGGARLSVEGMVAHLANELLLHGLDIARADGRPWRIAPEEAALTFQAFIVGILRGDPGRLLQYSRPGRPGRVRAELRSRYHEPIRLDAADGRLWLGDQHGPVDVRIWNDPAALMLMIWGRTGRVRPVLTGRVAVWGRRPWKVFPFLDAVRLP